MSNLVLSAFSDEYSESFTEQCEALNGFNIKFMEIRGVNGKNNITECKTRVLIY